MYFPPMRNFFTIPVISGKVHENDQKKGPSADGHLFIKIRILQPGLILYVQFPLIFGRFCGAIASL